MKPWWLVGIAAVFGGASVIVLPYVVIDFLSLPEHKISSTDWAAWAQALGTIIGISSAAFVAVYQQAKHQEMQEDQRKRKNFAARAVLPATLSELTAYINKCLDALAEYLDKRSEDESVSKFNRPSMPIDLINSLRDCVEFADDAPKARLAELIEKLQIQNSRLSLIDLETPRLSMITTRQTINARIVDALDIYARIELLFPYSRRASDGDPGAPTKENMKSAANIGHFIDDNDIKTMIDRRYN